MVKVFTELPREGLITIYADLVQRLYHEAFSVEAKCNIMFALLDAFALRFGADVELARLKRALNERVWAQWHRSQTIQLLFRSLAGWQVLTPRHPAEVMPEPRAVAAGACLTR